jgi:nitrogen fixation-related uncharacterized protein
MRILVGLGGFMLMIAPGTAFAHDNLGGDELAVANWMLVGAMITIVLGILAGVWAIKSGQFSNIEQSKFSMLDTAEDYDAIMAQADERERAARAARMSEQQNARPSLASDPPVKGQKQKQAHV